MKKKHKFNILSQFLLILIFLFNIQITFSQNTVKLIDSKLNRGKSQLIPVLGNLNLLNINSTDIIDFDFQFDSRLLFFDNIVTNSNTFFDKYNALKVTNSKEFPNQSQISASFIGKNENYTSNSNLDTLFYLSLEALVGPDSIAYITPKLLNKNNIIVTDTTFTHGRFEIGFPIFDIEKESIGLFYPNPFSYNSEIIFTLIKDSPISFAIYSADGKLVSKFPNNENSVKYQFTDNNNQVIDFNGNYSLGKGKYKLSIVPDSFIFSSGGYYVFISLNGNIFKTNFVYQK
jgi:hypothetical protein